MQSDNPISSNGARILRRSLLAGIMLAPVAFSAKAQDAAAKPPEATVMKFDFSAKPAAGYRAVAADAAYSAEQGFGFEPLRTGVTTPTPRLFSVAVPEGNYRVTVELGSATAASDTTVKAESRRLMVEAAKTAKGAFTRRTFIVNVRNSKLAPPPTNAPGFDSVATNDREAGSYTWDDKLTLEFAGPAPAVAKVEIEPATVPTIYIGGDSTVTDQRSESGASWGQMLTRFMKPEIAVANHAESGETMKSFLTGRRLDKLLSTMKPGDYFFIQFGHNDSKASWPQTYVAADSTYRDYLKVFIGEARRRGATPVLFNPPQRRNFNAAGKITNSHGGYPDAVRAVAKEMNVPMVDLTNISIAFYEALGPTDAPKAFGGNNGSDVTHHNNYGAYQLARGIVNELRTAVPALAPLITADAGPYDPAHPTPPGEFVLAPSASRSTVTPRGS